MTAGRVASIHRYPVKSMLGESVASSGVTERGVIGDRSHALLDLETGRVASAKNPKLWPGLLECRAEFVSAPDSWDTLPAIRVTMPDGSSVVSGTDDVDAALSVYTGRSVSLIRAVPEGALVDQYHPDIEDVNPMGITDRVTRFPPASAAPGTFQDVFPLHFLTTATLERYAELYPEGRFDVRRFRPNFVIEVPGSGFVENEWVGKRVAIGDVVVTVPAPTLRCVMTTVAQGNLPKDLGILRTAVKHNRIDIPAFGGSWPCVGAYGVLAGEPGAVAVGAEVTVT